jgi:hypothetical protein
MPSGCDSLQRSELARIQPIQQHYENEDQDNNYLTRDPPYFSFGSTILGVFQIPLRILDQGYQLQPASVIQTSCVSGVADALA